MYLGLRVSDGMRLSQKFMSARLMSVDGCVIDPRERYSICELASAATTRLPELPRISKWELFPMSSGGVQPLVHSLAALSFFGRAVSDLGVLGDALGGFGGTADGNPVRDGPFFFG